MKLLLTGATGRVGRHLLPRPVAQGHDVRAVARSEAGATQVKAAGAEPVLADLFEPGGYQGAIDDLNPERGKLKVMVAIFGRLTPVELEYYQVERL